MKSSCGRFCKLVITMMILIVNVIGDLHSSSGMVLLQSQLPACNNMSSPEVQALAESMKCPNLGNISIPSPFITDELTESCVPESRSNVLTNCTSTSTHQQALWQTFTKALPLQDLQRGLIGPPAIIGLISDAPHANPVHVNLTWDSSSMPLQSSINGSPWSAPSACRRPHSSTNLSHYFPTLVNLSKLYAANTDVFVSSNTKFLLFNCSNNRLHKSPAVDSILQVVNSSSLCQLYKRSCSSNLTAMFGAVSDCYELDWTDDIELLDSRYRGMGLSYLPLQSILDNMSCTHSEVFVVSSTGGSDQIAGVEQWLPGVMQLLLNNFGCKSCHRYRGECVYDALSGSYQGCNCSKNGDFRVLVEAISCSSSYGMSRMNTENCWKIGRIGFICDREHRIAVTYGAIGMGCLLFLVALCWCAYQCGKRSMKNRRLRRRALWERQHSVSSNSEPVANELIGLVGLSERPVEYTYKSIESATRSFSSLVGKGGFGVVFKGELPATRDINVSNQEQYSLISKEIAVKVLDDNPASRPSMSSVVQFLEGVAVVSQHPPPPTIAFASESSILDQKQQHFSSVLSNTDVTPR
ncbi:hypothetical protein L7F22_068883 [Adiantum nelumboides]|nr:hypothetical protein [Adiantum nelumboides]